MTQTAVMVGLKDADPKTILARYLSDETTESIAKDYGVTRQALGQFLYKTAEADWKEAQVARAIARKESADDTLDAIGSKIENADKEDRDRLALSLAHAKERLKSAQWDLERVCRRIYGQDAPPASVIPIQINIGIRREDATNAVQHEVIEAEGKSQD